MSRRRTGYYPALGHQVLCYFTLNTFIFGAQVLDAETIAPYRGMGGYEMLGRSMDRISTEDFESVEKACARLGLDGLVLVGGARSCTDAAYLSEYMLSRGSRTTVVAVPADMGCSIKNQFVETTVGFDTSCKVSATICGMCFLFKLNRLRLIFSNVYATVRKQCN